MSVACGWNFWAAVSDDGALYLWGRAPYRLTPTKVAGIPAPVAMIAARGDHFGIVTTKGELLMCGHGDHGRLGHGGGADISTPTLIDRAMFGNRKIRFVACGRFFTVALPDCGVVFTFGFGGHGQLGHGDDQHRWVPTEIPLARFKGHPIVMLAAGHGHLVALSEDGLVYTCGLGRSGQLGHGNDQDQRLPRQVEAARFAGKKLVFVAAGEWHTLAVTARGKLYTWGKGGHGQLGHGDSALWLGLEPAEVAETAMGGRQVSTAACGDDHTLVVTCDGALWACGRGHQGQLGLGDDEDRSEFSQVPVGERDMAMVVTAAAAGFRSMCITDNGALYAWGAGICEFHPRFGGRHHTAPARLGPSHIDSGCLAGVRLGFGRRIPKEHVLAFAMGTHGRLGAAIDTHCSCLAKEHGLLQMIVNF